MGKRTREKLNNDTTQTTTMTLIVNYKSFDEKDIILRDTGVINAINHEWNNNIKHYNIFRIGNVCVFWSDKIPTGFFSRVLKNRK